MENVADGESDTSLDASRHESPNNTRRKFYRKNRKSPNRKSSPVLSEENTSSEEAVDEFLLICPRRRKSFRGQNICLNFFYGNPFRKMVLFIPGRE